MHVDLRLPIHICYLFNTLVFRAMVSDYKEQLVPRFKKIYIYIIYIFHQVLRDKELNKMVYIYVYTYQFLSSKCYVYTTGYMLSVNYFIQDIFSIFSNSLCANNSFHIHIPYLYTLILFWYEYDPWFLYEKENIKIDFIYR